MTLIEIEAKRHHLGQMTRLLRSDHADALAKSPRSIHRQLVEIFDASVIRRAWLLDDKLVALAGLAGTLLDTEGRVWAALSEDVALTRPLLVARTAARFLNRYAKTRAALATDVLQSDRPSYLFALHLGFNTVGRAMIDGIDTVRMVNRTRKAA